MSRLAIGLLGLAALLASCSAAYTTTTIAKRPNHDKYVGCYFQHEALYRNGNGRISITSDIKPEYCTHLIYAFACINGTTFTAKSCDEYIDLEINNGNGGYRRMTQLQYQYPHLKVSLAIGGWEEGSYSYSEMARRPETRKQFVNSVVDMLRSYNFHGLDLAWEFPAARDGAEYDKYNYILLLQDLKRALKPLGYLLTAAISADVDSMERRYDLRRMTDYVDYIHLMTYNYHVVEGGVVMPNAPLDEVNKTLNYLVDLNLPMKKFILGLPAFGHTYTLAEALRSQAENPIGKPSLRRGWEGPDSKLKGFLRYNEVCKFLLSNESWIDRWDNFSSTPYAHYQFNVIVYDNVKSLKMKVHLGMQKGLSGVMIWSIDMDDFRGDCIPNYKRNLVELHDYQYPLLKAITQALEKNSAGDAAAAAPLRILVFFLAALAARLCSI